jgi:hypothetical protein
MAGVQAGAEFIEEMDSAIINIKVRHVPEETTLIELVNELEEADEKLDLTLDSFIHPEQTKTLVNILKMVSRHPDWKQTLLMSRLITKPGWDVILVKQYVPGTIEPVLKYLTVDSMWIAWDKFAEKFVNEHFNGRKDKDKITDYLQHMLLGYYDPNNPFEYRIDFLIPVFNGN